MTLSEQRCGRHHRRIAAQTTRAATGGAHKVGEELHRLRPRTVRRRVATEVAPPCLAVNVTVSLRRSVAPRARAARAFLTGLIRSVAVPARGVVARARP